VFNEKDNIPGVHASLMRVLTEKNKFYVFVDDCSTDGTVEIIRSTFDNSNLHVIEKENNRGPGDSFNRGFDWILEHSKNDDDIVITMEGDNTADVDSLGNMVNISGMGYDLVLASVYSQGGRLEKTTFFRRLLSLCANMILRFSLKLSVLTLSSFFRIYHVSLLNKIKTTNHIIIKEDGFLCMVEILLKAVKSEANIIEVPTVLLSEKRIGKSKMKVFQTMMDYIRLILREIFK